jgi:NodT family efflux transporter outer membrane factor (OMF) lipoprotein
MKLSAALASSLLWALACQVPEQRNYEEVPLEVPATFAADRDAAGAAPALDRWWRTFESAELAQVVDEILAHNHDVVAAAYRLRAAEAEARSAGAALWPAVGAAGDGGRQRQNFIGLPIPGGSAGVLSSTTSSYGVSLNVSWELDLWGKLDAREQAASADFAAGLANFHGLRLSLAGQAVKTWLALAEAGLQRDLAARRVASLERSAQVVRLRFAEGRAPALDLRLAEAELAAAEAQRSAQLLVLERVTRELEFLCGGYPAGALPAPAALPDLPAAVPTGLPSELLRRRPDLVAAEEKLRSSDLRLFAARKELWPSLSLTAGAGRRSAELGDLPDDDFSIWNLAGNLTLPIFQGGRLQAGIEAAQAEVQAVLAEYAQAILRAFLEVEIALAIEASLDDRERQLALAAERAGDARELAEERYRAGRSDILTVLTAERQAFSSESAWVGARRERLEQRVDLYLALGGGFGSPAVSHSPSPDPSASDGLPGSR